MPPALFKLMGMQFRGFARRIFRGSTGIRRAMMFGFGALVIVLWLLPSVLMARRGQPSDPHRIRLAAPFALLGVCVLTLVSSAGDGAISFTPGEVDMLFPGPFSRRQLIGYKLIKSTVAAAASSVVLSIVLLRHARWWPACYAGVLLSLLFIQFFSINTVLIVQTFGATAQSKLRLATLALVGIAAIVIARHVGPVAGSFDAVHWMERIDAIPLAHAMLSPFAVFGRLMTSESAGELARNGMLALLIVLGLYAAGELPRRCVCGGSDGRQRPLGEPPALPRGIIFIDRRKVHGRADASDVSATGGSGHDRMAAICERWAERTRLAVPAADPGDWIGAAAQFTWERPDIRRDDDRRRPLDDVSDLDDVEVRFSRRSGSDGRAEVIAVACERDCASGSW